MGFARPSLHPRVLRYNTELDCLNNLCRSWMSPTTRANKFFQINPCLFPGEGHELLFEFKAQKEKLMNEELVLSDSRDPSQQIKLVFHARVLGELYISTFELVMLLNVLMQPHHYHRLRPSLAFLSLEKRRLCIRCVCLSVCEPIFSRTMRHTEPKFFSVVSSIHMLETVKILFISDNVLGLHKKHAKKPSPTRLMKPRVHYTAYISIIFDI